MKKALDYVSDYQLESDVRTPHALPHLELPEDFCINNDYESRKYLSYQLSYSQF